MYKKKYDDAIFKRADFPIVLDADKTLAPEELTYASRTWHETLEIKYFTSGSCSVIVDTNAIITRPGDIVVINPYEFHSSVGSSDDSCRYHLLMIGMEFFSSCNMDGFDMKQLFLDRGVRFNNLIRENTRIQNVLSRIVEELTAKAAAYEMAVRGLVLELFALLMRDQIRETVSADGINKNIRHYKSIAPAVEYIRMNHDKKISVEELASLCHMSKFHFCRIFKLATNMTVVEYITEYRLSFADLLLRNSKMSIADIAHAAGFEDECYFSRRYKKSRGVSPKNV